MAAVALLQVIFPLGSDPPSARILACRAGKLQRRHNHPSEWQPCDKVPRLTPYAQLAVVENSRALTRRKITIV